MPDQNFSLPPFSSPTTLGLKHTLLCSKFPVGLAHTHGPHEVLERHRKTHVFGPWGHDLGGSVLEAPPEGNLALLWNRQRKNGQFRGCRRTSGNMEGSLHELAERSPRLQNLCTQRGTPGAKRKKSAMSPTLEALRISAWQGSSPEQRQICPGIHQVHSWQQQRVQRRLGSSGS